MRQIQTDILVCAKGMANKYVNVNVEFNVFSKTNGVTKKKTGQYFMPNWNNIFNVNSGNWQLLELYYNAPKKPCSSERWTYAYHRRIPVKSLDWRPPVLYTASLDLLSCRVKYMYQLWLCANSHPIAVYQLSVWPVQSVWEANWGSELCDMADCLMEGGELLIAAKEQEGN